MEKVSQNQIEECSRKYLTLQTIEILKNKQSLRHCDNLK